MNYGVYSILGYDLDALERVDKVYKHLPLLLFVSMYPNNTRQAREVHVYIATKPSLNYSLGKFYINTTSVGRSP